MPKDPEQEVENYMDGSFIRRSHQQNVSRKSPVNMRLTALFICEHFIAESAHLVCGANDMNVLMFA